MISSNVIGERIKQYRLNQNLSQQGLAELAGLSRTAVVKAEQGASSLETYIAIMQALGRADAFEAAFPEESISPVDLLERGQRKRQRAYGSATSAKDHTKELDW